MPFLRFSRDKRGYETTVLVHAFRHDGRTLQRVLYWYRTPPGVKVGRPAFDAEAIRSIEARNPDVEFDWPKILAAKPAPAAPAETPARRKRDSATRERKAAAAPAPEEPEPEQSDETAEEAPVEAAGPGARAVDAESPARRRRRRRRRRAGGD